MFIPMEGINMEMVQLTLTECKFSPGRDAIESGNQFIGYISYIDNFTEGPKTGYLFCGLKEIEDCIREKYGNCWFRGWNKNDVVCTIQKMVTDYISSFYKRA
jgi:hypothetical protein